MIKHIIDIEAISTGKKVRFIDIQNEAQSAAYYANMLDGCNFFKENKLKNQFEYLMEINYVVIEL